MSGEASITLVYNKNRDLYMFYSSEGIEVCYGKCDEEQVY